MRASPTPPRFKTVIGTLATIISVAMLVALCIIALVSSVGAQSVFLLILALAGLSLVNGLRKYPGD